MKSDIDALMQERDLDAILVVGPAQHNPPMHYLTGGGHLTHAMLIKKRGAEPMLFHNSMEREEAASTGLNTTNLDVYGIEKLLKQAGGDVLQASVMRYQRMLADVGITGGRMAIYGKSDAGESYAIFSALQEAVPELTIIGELQDSVLLTAMATKDDPEIERIRRMGQITTQVVGKVADYLTYHRVRDEVL
ncbi:MAG: aminopeptidase P family N-terminal domain-containing protein, partial [Chloroflexota bacterium]|nr:aminopeptidase P family N-terminal domain-containing protein [Chloroflexota bacterium]